MPEWDDEDDINDSKLVKDLRKQIDAANKAKAELEKELGTLRPQVRKNSVTSVLSELGFNSKISGLIPESVEPTKEAVSSWIKDFSDVFNLQKTEEEKPEEKTEAVETPAGQATQVVPENVQEQWARIQGGNAAAGVTTPDIEKQQVAQLGRAVAASNGDYDKFIAMLRNDIVLPN